MRTGRPRLVEPAKLYTFAHEFYWDFRALADGNVRWGVDRDKYRQLIKEIDTQPLPADDYDKMLHARQVEDEIRAGRLEVAQREERLQELERKELSKRRPWLRTFAADDAEKEIRIPGDPDTLKELLRARTAERVRRICEDAYTYRQIEVSPGVMRKCKVRNWPLDVGSTLPSYLSVFAGQFVKAKRDPRFPRSNRPTSQLKQLWFLSRALAGAVFGESTRTAINLVGSLRPEQMFEESGAAKHKRRRKRGKRT
jgi:hypothetical protein